MTATVQQKPWTWARPDYPPLEQRTVGFLLDRAADMFGARPFASYDGVVVSYAEMHKRANKVANALHELGVNKGMRVGILSTNRLECLDIWFGLAKLGAIELPINPEYTAAQFRHTLVRSPAKFLIAEPELVSRLALNVDDLNDTEVIALDSGIARSKMLFQDLVEHASDQQPRYCSITGTDPVAIMNTSGTTGLSKGVVLPHAQQVILGENMVTALRMSEKDIFYNFFPFFHNTAKAMITLPVMMTGASMMLTKKFSVSRFWNDIHSSGASLFYFIGEMLHLLLNAPPSGSRGRPCLRAGFGIGARPQEMAEFKDRYGVSLATCYGTTEGNVPVFRPLGSDAPLESVGRVIPGFEMKIINEQDKEAGPGEVGEIVQRSTAPFMMMSGYDGDPATTCAVMRDGWFHTGDAGKADEHGNIYFVARLKDVIRVGGENISGFEIEVELAQFPGVAEVAAIAVPGELGGDLVKAVIVPQLGVTIDPQEFVEFCERRMPRRFVPRYVEFCEALPKTGTNKIQKHLLRERGLNPDTWDRLKAGYLT